MSWSLNRIGKPAGLKTALGRDFESAKESTKHIPSEHAAVALLHEVVEGQLNFYQEHAPGNIFHVVASGHQYVKTDNYPGGGSIEFSLKPIGPLAE